MVLLVGGREVINGGLSLGDFAAFYTYLIMLTAPMRMLGMSLGMAQRAVASGNRVFEILDREPRIESPPDAPPLPDGPGRGRAARRLARLRRRRAGARGRRAEGRGGAGPSRWSGPSGSGKTSLVALLARLYDPSRGRVLMDGADLRTRGRRLAALADRVRRRRQLPVLGVGGREHRLRAARTRRRRRSRLAARRAQAHGFIERLPDGYETLVGERGLTLSGGQRQRIAIARALLADPRILILDDATSSVDARTEAAIKRGLARGDGRADDVHRRPPDVDDLARRRDRGHGRRAIVDRGTHEELLERCPLYAEIAEHGMEDSVFLQRDLEQREEVARL